MENAQPQPPAYTLANLRFNKLCTVYNCPQPQSPSYHCSKKQAVAPAIAPLPETQSADSFFPLSFLNRPGVFFLFSG